MKRHLWISPVLVGALGLMWLVQGQLHAVRGDEPGTTPHKIMRMPPDPQQVSDEAVRESLARGSAFLLAQFKEGEIVQGSDVSPAFHQGLNALCVYALLNAGQATRDSQLMPTSDVMRRLIENMKIHPMTTDRDRPQSPVVYARSLRAAALALYARPQDMEVLRDDVQWLVDASVEGAYSYDDRASYRVIPDESGATERTGGRLGSSPVDHGPMMRGGSSPKSPPRPSSPTSPIGSPPAWTRRPVVSSPPIRVILHPPAYRPRPPRLVTGTFRRPPARPSTPPARKPTGVTGGGGVRTVSPPSLPPPNYPPQELPEEMTPFIWDNSNSQYGFMGVLSGAEAGIEVPDEYFQAVQGHWMTYQLRTGEWPYRLDRPVGYLAMTCAGVASLMTAHDYLEAPLVAQVGQRRGEVDEALGAGLEWLSRADNAVTVDGPQKVYVGYTLFGLERVGLASGYKYFGVHDWYPELARKVVQSQSPGGSWGKSEEPTADTLIDTAYSVLFLARGRHPVMMNKLQLDPAGKSDHGEWNNRPRDLANLARFASWELERPVQWQVVPIDRSSSDWSDAPILYLASHAALRLSDSEVAKIRAFIDAGGMFFTQADDGAGAFNTYIDQLAKRLYADRELKDLPRDHDIYTLQYQLPPGKRPRLRGMVDGNGRLVWVHSPTDLALSWQQRAVKSKREIFELGVNLFAYAVGKSDLRNRLQPRVIAAGQISASAPTMTLTRIRHAGAWDPQPLAFEQFARWFAAETSLKLDARPSDASALPTSATRIAHLVLPIGTSLSDSDASALRQYVSAGGTLIVESPGATSVAATSPRNTVRGERLGSGLAQIFPQDHFVAVTEGHPLVNATADGMEKIWPLKIRPYVTKQLGDDVPPIRVARIGAGRVIHLPLDLSTGLIGCAQWGVLGYEPATARPLMKNLLLWPNTPQ